MTSLRDLRDRYQKTLARYEPRLKSFAGFTGDHGGSIDVPNRRGYIYIRDWVGVVHEVYNTIAPTDQPGYAVRVSSDPVTPSLLFVSNLLNPHVQKTTGVQNGFDPETLRWPNENTLFIDGPQLLVGGLVTAVGGMTVRVYPFWLRTPDEVIYIPTEDIDLTSSIPSSGACWVAISYAPDGTMSLDVGEILGSLALLMLQPISVEIDPSYKTVAAVALYADMIEVLQTPSTNTIADLRWTSNNGSRVSWGTIVGSIDDQVDLFRFSGGHAHGTSRWIADGTTTTFELIDIFESLEAVFDNSLRVDPLEVELSGDGTQVVFSTAPTDTHVLIAEGIVRTI